MICKCELMSYSLMIAIALDFVPRQTEAADRRILDGTTADRRGFKSMVRLSIHLVRLADNNDNRTLTREESPCSGFAITRSLVLTSAHCFSSFIHCQPHCGVNVTLTAGQQTRGATHRHLVLHPSTAQLPHAYDRCKDGADCGDWLAILNVALLKLDVGFDFDDQTGSIPLLSDPVPSDAVVDGCEMVGYGKTKSDGGSYVLNRATGRAGGTDFCEKLKTLKRLTWSDRIGVQGAAKSLPCASDSLIWRRPGVEVALGVFAGGVSPRTPDLVPVECGAKGLFAVYTPSGLVADWAKDNDGAGEIEFVGWERVRGEVAGCSIALLDHTAALAWVWVSRML